MNGEMKIKNLCITHVYIIGKIGVYNGMECIIALLEVREPKFINCKEVKFLSEKDRR